MLEVAGGTPAGGARMKGLIFTYVLTYGGAVFSLFDPYIGFLIYVCFSIIKPESLWFWSVPAGNYSRIVAIALLVGWALKGFGRWQFGSARAVIFALIGFWAWAGLSAIQAQDRALALDWLEGISKIVLPVVVGITIIDSVKQLKQLAWVIVVSQGYVAYDFNQSYYAGFNRVTEVGFGGMDNNCVAISMVACAGLAFFLGLNAEGWWRKAIAFAASGLMIHCVFFSFSRGGMSALVLTGALAFVLIPKQPKHYLIFALAVLLAWRLAGTEVTQRFLTSFVGEEQRDESARSRTELWRDCLDIANQNPLFGVGARHFGLVAPRYGWPIGKEAHSLWLQMLAELGYPGGIMLMLYYGICVVRLWPLVRESTPVPHPWFRDCARMVIASLVGFAVAAQFVTLPGLEVPYYITLLGAGTLKLFCLAPRDIEPADETGSESPGDDTAESPDLEAVPDVYVHAGN
jgi:probable O-glycosylation ligase (exosortase A-associated)